MRVTMMLADHAQALEGKLYIMGGGWTWTGPPSPSAIALLFEIPWDRANEQLEFRLDLLDEDGQPVMVDTPDGEVPLWVGGGFEVTRPLGHKRGTPVNFPVAINLPPQDLPPGSRYEWRLTLDGENHEDWRLAFSTRGAEARPF